MIRVPTFARNSHNQLTHTGYRDQTPDEQLAETLHGAGQVIDIKRHFADNQKRSDVRGFKEQQRLLREKAWRPDYVRPQGGDLKPFNSRQVFARRRGLVGVAA